MIIMLDKELESWYSNYAPRIYWYGPTAARVWSRVAFVSASLSVVSLNRSFAMWWKGSNPASCIRRVLMVSPFSFSPDCGNPPFSSMNRSLVTP